MTGPTDGIPADELETQEAADLPDRQAMSLISGLPDTSSLLNVDVNLNADAQVAAPIDAAVAANANVAAPIDAAVSANIGSVGSVSGASAEQAALITQNLNGVATATADQGATIAQGTGS